MRYINGSTVNENETRILYCVNGFSSDDVDINFFVNDEDVATNKKKFSRVNNFKSDSNSSANKKGVYVMLETTENTTDHENNIIARGESVFVTS